MAHVEDPHPSGEERQALARQTGLSCREVSAWFLRARVHDWQRYRALAQTHGEGRSESDTASEDDMSDWDAASPVHMSDQDTVCDGDMSDMNSVGDFETT